MKKNILTLLLAFVTVILAAQENGIRKIDVLGNKVAFKELVHASIYFEINGKVIYVDPWGADSLYKGLAKADAILITDVHPDHYSVENIKALMTENTFFIAPMAVYEMMPDEWKGICTILNNDEFINFKDIRLKITATPMYNMPEGSDQPHVKGRGNGYLIDVDDFIIYVSGDTGGTPEMRALTNVDVAFVCMNLPYTMSVDDAIAAVNEFKPKKVYPYHYRNQDGTFGDVEKFCKKVSSPETKCVALDWY